MENGIFVGKNSSGMSAEGSRIMYLQFVGRETLSKHKFQKSSDKPEIL